MNEITGRSSPLHVRQKDLRIGDVLYGGDDEPLGAVCEGIRRGRGVYIYATWRIVATGETFTDGRHENDGNFLMRRGPAAGPREDLWDKLGIDPDRVSREEFEAHMDAYDRAVATGPVRPGEEPT
ncbi:hypothetical protein [Streptomyces sp. NPDC002088]|uniref:hypothetical protein n=1 Tax=Streptomyces sp. NPDC002088 TaxID=3154665 RepID=UPI00332B48EA